MNMIQRPAQPPNLFVWEAAMSELDTQPEPVGAVGECGARPLALLQRPLVLVQAVGKVKLPVDGAVHLGDLGLALVVLNPWWRNKSYSSLERRPS